MDSSTALKTGAEADFTALLEESSSFNQPERGDVLSGVILAIDNHGLIVDVGLKRDGVVPRSDLEKLDDHTAFAVGAEIPVMVLQPEDREGNLVVSISQARQSKDWTKAEELLASGEMWEGVVTDANRGGLIMPFGNLRGFVPASHVMDLPRGLSETERKAHLTEMVGKSVAVKVIEVNRRRRRLVLSQREAQRRRRDKRKETLLEELVEGQVHKGVVSGLRDFGAFVDLGGADGLIHISELAWHRVRHPSELLSVGDEVEVYVLRLDKEGKRIGLSLKRLQPNPWMLVDDIYHVGQLVEGEVSRVAQFGAFVSLEPGIEALLHTSQMSDPPPDDPTQVVYEGQRLLMRVISVESHRQRLGLSLKEVAEEERQRREESELTEEEAPPAELQAKASPDAGMETTDAVQSVSAGEQVMEESDMPGAPAPDIATAAS
jgi:small subunit ribosomal protein S1